MNLDYNLYKRISDQIKGDLENHDEVEWYQYSYKIYVSHNLDSIDDFWKVVAFAYSWMPTIPTIYYKKIKGKEDRLFSELRKLKQGKGDIPWLFNTLTPIINNSVVGTSKVLHFIAPDSVPIYDSRVISAWSKLFKSDKKLRLQFKSGGDIGKVLFYVEKMEEWLAECLKYSPYLKLRDIELMLYYYGGKKGNNL